eukprot:6337469-Karenia_brevis.AAC.1
MDVLEEISVHILPFSADNVKGMVHFILRVWQASMSFTETRLVTCNRPPRPIRLITKDPASDLQATW